MQYCVSWKVVFPTEYTFYAHTYLIWEELHKEGPQKNYAQTLWIQFALHQADTEKATRQLGKDVDKKRGQRTKAGTNRKNR